MRTGEDREDGAVEAILVWEKDAQLLYFVVKPNCEGYGQALFYSAVV